MLFGKTPFTGDDRWEVFSKIVKEEPSFKQSYWNKISEDAIDLIKKLLVKDPRRRLDINDA